MSFIGSISQTPPYLRTPSNSPPLSPHLHKDVHISLSRPPHASNTSLHVMSLPNGQIYRRPSNLEQHPSRSGEDAGLHRRSASFEKRDPFSSPDIYYGDEDAFRKQFVGWSGRAVSSVSRLRRAYIMSRHMLKSADHQSVGQSWIYCLEGQYSRSQTKPW